jgi:hypothetical protein
MSARARARSAAHCQVWSQRALVLMDCSHFWVEFFIFYLCIYFIIFAIPAKILDSGPQALGGSLVQALVV